MGDLFHEILDRLEAIYREGIRLLEIEDYEQLAPLLSGRRELFEPLRDLFGDTEELSEELKARVLEIGAQEDRFEQLLRERIADVQRVLHQDALGRKKLQEYQVAEE